MAIITNRKRRGLLSAVLLLLSSGCTATVQQVALTMMVRDAKAGTPKHPFCFSGIFYSGGQGIVVEVAPSSQRFGVEPGDKIKTIDGEAWYPPAHASLSDAWKGWEVSRLPGQHVRIGLERDGKDRTIDLVCEDAQALYAKPLLAGADALVAKNWDSCLYNVVNVIIGTGPNEWAYFLRQQCVLGKFNSLGQPQSMIPDLVSVDLEFYSTLVRHTRIAKGDLAPLRPGVLQSIESMRKLGYPEQASELETLLNQDTLKEQHAQRLKGEAEQREDDKRRYAVEIARLQKEKAVALATAQEARAAAARAEARAGKMRAANPDSDEKQSKPGTGRPTPARRAKPPVAKTAKGATPELVGTGTCFAVEKAGGVLTSNHVVSAADQVVVRFPGQEWIEGTVETQDTANDLALIRLPVSLPHVLKIHSGSRARLGEQIFTIGFPVPQLLGFSPKFSEGTVASLDGPAGSPTMFQMTVPIQPGNSGGPVVGMDGGVLGVVASTAKVEAFFAASGAIPQNVNWAVNASYAAPLLTVTPEAVGDNGREKAIENAQEAVCQIATFRWPVATKP